MAYCNYVSNTDCTVAYRYGARADDITRLLIFHFSKGEEGFEVIKEPEKASPWEVHVMRKKISYKIG